MTFRDLFFYFTSFLALIAIFVFLYFALQVNWPPMPALGGEVPTTTLDEKPEAPLTQQQKEGQKLFRTYCAACHKVDRVMTGPALAGVGKKYEDDKDWLYRWIRNSQELVKAGEPKAVALFEEYEGVIMQANPTLTDEQIEAILAFTG